MADSLRSYIFAPAQKPPLPQFSLLRYTQRGYAARAAPTQKNPIKPINLLFPHAKFVEPLPPTATPGAKAGRTHNYAHNASPVTPPPRAHHMHTYSYPHLSREPIHEQKYVETATLPLK